MSSANPVGAVTDPADAELDLLSETELAAGVRLACQTKALSSLKVKMPPESLSGRQELQTTGLKIDIAPAPAIKRLDVELERSTILDREKFINAGNAAGTGARLCLISTHERKTAELIAGKVEYVELATKPEFSSTYVGSLEFPG